MIQMLKIILNKQ